MDKMLLDTDMLSEVMKAKDERVVETAVTHQSIHTQLTTSVVTVMEIIKGLHNGSGVCNWK